jgi:hypothetical protein
MASRSSKCRLTTPPDRPRHPISSLARTRPASALQQWAESGCSRLWFPCSGRDKLTSTTQRNAYATTGIHRGARLVGERHWPLVSVARRAMTPFNLRCKRVIYRMSAKNEHFRRLGMRSRLRSIERENPKMTSGRRRPKPVRQSREANGIRRYFDHGRGICRNERCRGPFHNLRQSRRG